MTDPSSPPTSTPRPAPAAPLTAAMVLEEWLLGASMSDTVEMVIHPIDENRYRVATAEGWIRLDRFVSDDGRYGYEVTGGRGENPLGRVRTDALVGLASELEAGNGTARDVYPHAFDSIAQFFDAQHAPDLLVTHAGAHAYGGNVGQHGSLGVLQARAPFIAAGAGVLDLGMIDESARMIDIAPTVAALLGLPVVLGASGPTGAPRVDARLVRQDGDPIDAVLDGTVAEHVLVALLDGCNANLLYDAIDAGEAPNIAALLERGTGLRHGLYSSLPTATLANHTTAITGAHPGHSGVLHNTWIDRDTGEVPNLLSMDEVFWSARHVRDDVETIFEAIHRSKPDAYCTATFEFADRGADFSSFALVRAGTSDTIPELDDVTHLTRRYADESGAYDFMSRVDHLSTSHTVDCWEHQHGNPLPTLSWCSLALTDEAAHESGPHGELARAAVRDTDARVGDLLDAIERAGATDRTAVIVMADHGMEHADRSVDRSWDDDLVGCPVAHRIVGDGLVYLGEWGGASQ